MLRFLLPTRSVPRATRRPLRRPAGLMPLLAVFLCALTGLATAATPASAPTSTPTSAPDSTPAQTADHAAAVTALQDYLDGTSYDRVEQIRRAFTPTAKLYLNGENGGMKEVSIDEYLGWFGRKPGQFTGRIGNLISLEIDGDIATAKAEILVPKRATRFVDLFLLRKLDGQWRIISKTAVSATAPAHGRKVLLVLSNADQMPGSTLNAGNSFAELSRAWASFRAAGYIVHAVSPNGGAVPLAYINTTDPLEKAHVYDRDFMAMLAHTRTPAQVSPADYAAVFYMGGSAAMFGVADNDAIQKLAMSVYEQHNGVVAAVCHGSAGIVNLKLADGTPLVAGKRVTGYPDAFENKTAPYYKTFPFSIEQKLAAGGGKFSHGARATSHVEADGRLITGMNWESTAGVAEAVIRQIEAAATAAPTLTK